MTNIELQDKLNQASDNSGLKIDYTLFGEHLNDAEHFLASVINHFPLERALIFSTVESITEDQGSIIVKGNGGNEIFNSMALEATFVFDSEGKVHALIVASPSAGYKFVQSFFTDDYSPVLTELTFSEAKFYLDTHGDLGVYGPGLIFKGTPGFSAPFNSLNFLLQQFLGEYVEGRIYISELGPSFKLTGLNAYDVAPNGNGTQAKTAAPNYNSHPLKICSFM